MDLLSTLQLRDNKSPPESFQWTRRTVVRPQRVVKHRRKHVDHLRWRAHCQYLFATATELMLKREPFVPPFP
jgi:hypothetical protein